MNAFYIIVMLYFIVILMINMCYVQCYIKKRSDWIYFSI